jgi:hypothetical protein
MLWRESWISMETLSKMVFICTTPPPPTAAQLLPIHTLICHTKLVQSVKERNRRVQIPFTMYREQAEIRNIF